MYAMDFEYADKRLSDFNCTTCTINSSGGVEEVNIGCDITFSTVKNYHTFMQSRTSSSYDSVYATDFQIMKNEEENGENKYFTYEEVRAIYRWLNRHEYSKFKPLPDDEQDYDVHYFGSFNIDEVILNGRIIGLTLHFVSNAPYGFGEENHFHIAISEDNNTFSLYGDSDEVNYAIYPKVVIHCMSDTGEDGLTIRNRTTGTMVHVKNCLKNEVLTIDGVYKIITSSIEEHTTLPNDFNYGYLDIAVNADDDLENIYEVSAPCAITITYSPIRKVGV